MLSDTELFENWNKSNEKKISYIESNLCLPDKDEFIIYMNTLYEEFERNNLDALEYLAREEVALLEYLERFEL